MRHALVVLLVAGLLALAGGPAFAQDTETPTPANTNTPANTATFTPTPKTNYAAAGYSGSQAVGRSDAGDVVETFSFVASDSLVLWENDVIHLVHLPKGAVLLDWGLYVPAIDGATSLTFDLGTTESPAAFLLDSDIGQAGGFVSSTNALSSGLVPSALPTSPLAAGTVLNIKVTAGATGAGAGGTLKGWIRYHLHGSGVF